MMPLVVWRVWVAPGPVREELAGGGRNLREIGGGREDHVLHVALELSDLVEVRRE